jgi:hypothetical protein
MNLAPHIKALLYRHDCVIIPDLGAIVATYEPAEINYASKTIYPPGKSIIFNRELKYNDGLLIGHISGAGKETFQETQSLLEKAVREIKSVLADGKQYILEDLGYFYADRKNNILFQPDLKTNLMLDSYGLSFVRYREEVTPHKSLKYRHMTEGATGSFYRSGMRRWLYTAAAASVVTAFVLLTIPMGESGNRILNISSVNPFKKERVASPASDVQVTTYGAEGHTISSLPAGPPGITTDRNGTGMYHIIVGSYSNFGNAREQINRIRMKGWNARLLFTASDSYRVSVFSSADMDESLKELRLVKQEICESAWLYNE